MGVKLTAEQMAKVKEMNKSGDKQGAIDYVKSIQNGVTTTTTTPKTTTPTTSTNKSSNTQWSSTNYKDSDGYYSGTERNAATGGSEFGGSSKTSTQTSAQTPSSSYSTRPSDILIKGESEYDPNTGYYRASQTKQGGDTSGKQVGGQKTIYNSDQIRATWDKLPYEEQQKRLQASPGLKDELAKMGITIKTKPGATGETPTTPTTPTTTGGDGWDYQDNSPERMKQIADNVNQFAQTDPYIFNNEDSFRKFFIDGKGRTPEQEAFLMDLYKNRKKYNELDNYTADNIGNMAVNGQIPDSYLTYLKNTNPDRYAAVMDAKARETDKIKDKASMDTISSMDGGADYTSQTSTVIEWLKSQGLLVDKDGNLIDDRTENYASEEEKGYLKQIADLNATNLDIDNTVKHTYDDLVKAYPGATKATLMAMAQDMNADLLREKENNLVELTRLQGYVGYMQSERQERDTIGQNAINQLQKQYGMYYSYSPEGMSQLAQAQYAATNVTLDQADNGTDTQKQMALQRVLDDYYAKYGDIIQRSEAQVINDVMAYAKNNGVSLSQALEENFLKFLRQKPEYIQMVSGGVDGYGDWTVIGEDDLGNKVYGFVNSSTGVVVPYGNTYGGTGVGGTYQFTESEVRTGDTIGNDINSIGHILDSEDGLRVGTYKSSNGYTYNVYANREEGIQATENLLKKGYYGMTLGDAAQKWIGKGKDISAAKNVIKNKGLSLDEKLSDANVRKFIEAMGTWEGTLKGKSLDDWAAQGKDLSGYKQPEGEATTGKFDKGLANVYAQYAEANAKDKAQIAARNGKTTQQMDAEVYEYEGWKNAQDLKQSLDMVDRLLYGDIEIPPRLQRMDTIGGEENDLGMWGWVTIGNMSQRNTDWEAAHNLIYNTLGMDKFLDLKSKGATFGALSDDERRAIYDAASAFKANLSEAEYKRQLQYIRDSIIEAGRGYLDNYSYKGSTMDDAAAKLGLVKSQKA